MPSYQERFVPIKKKALAKIHKKVVAGSVPTLAQMAPKDGGCESIAVAAPMEVHPRNWHCLNLFRPPYVCGQCHKTVYLWCMYAL